jgi:hypothetical protein
MPLFKNKYEEIKDHHIVVQELTASKGELNTSKPHNPTILIAGITVMLSIING